MHNHEQPKQSLTFSPFQSKYYFTYKRDFPKILPFQYHYDWDGMAIPLADHCQQIYWAIMDLRPLLCFLALATSVLSLTLLLHNGLYTATGGYTTTIHLGTPPQQFEVHIDTGSGKLIVPCKECTSCQQNPHRPFDWVQSSSFKKLSCSSGGAFCDDCIASTQGDSLCKLDVSYQDGGWLKGTIISDLFSATGLAHPIQTSFGCSSQQSIDFMTDTTTDGIWGLGKSAADQYGHLQRMDQLIVAISALSHSPRLVALCLATEGGFMNIGTLDNSLHSQPGIVIPYDTPSGDTISNALSTISIGNSVLTTQGSSQLPQLIIDSGTTASTFSQNIYHQLISQLQSICNEMGDCQSDTGGDQTCFRLTDHNQFSRFPPIVFTFSGSQVYWHAQEYFSSEGDQQYCVSFGLSSQSDSYLLGDDFMLNKDIVFGESTITIYQQSRCSGELISYQYNPNQPHILSSQAGSSHQKGTTNRVILAIGLTLLLAVFVAVVAYVFRRCRRVEEGKETQSNNPEEAIQDVVGTDVRFNQQIIEKQSAQQK